MKDYNEYDNIVIRCKTSLQSSESIAKISIALNVKPSFIIRVNDRYAIRENISKFNKYKLDEFYDLTILNKDKTLIKKDILYIMQMSLSTLNSHMKMYNIVNVNDYRKTLCIELLKAGELSVLEICNIVHYREPSVYRIQKKIIIPKQLICGGDEYTKRRKTNNCKNSIDITGKTSIINKCRNMLMDIELGKKDIAKNTGLKLNEVEAINDKFKIRGYNFRKVVSTKSKEIAKLSRTGEHDVKDICDITNMSESAVRAVIRKYNIPLTV